jgi:hypothetical protein
MNPCPKTILCGLLSAGLAATTACGASGENAPDTDVKPAAADSTASARRDACPLAVAGTTSSTEDTVDGVVVTFATTRAGDIPELRRRVEELAAAHNSTSAAATDDLAAAPPQAPGPTAAPESTPAGEARDEPTATGGKLDSEAAAETGEQGVRLVLRPRDPAHVDSMRDHLRKQADDLVQRVCDQAGRKALR